MLEEIKSASVTPFTSWVALCYTKEFVAEEILEKTKGKLLLSFVLVARNLEALIVLSCLIPLLLFRHSYTRDCFRFHRNKQNEGTLAIYFNSLSVLCATKSSEKVEELAKPTLEYTNIYIDLEP